jgi:hypothetical protein
MVRGPQFEKYCCRGDFIDIGSDVIPTELLFYYTDYDSKWYLSVSASGCRCSSYCQISQAWPLHFVPSNQSRLYSDLRAICVPKQGKSTD